METPVIRHGETKPFNKEGFGRRILNKIKEVCTVDGRSEKLWLTQYSQVLEQFKQLNPEASAEEVFRIEQTLRDKCRSTAQGGLIFDGLLVGGSLAGAGLLASKVLKEQPDLKKFIKFQEKLGGKLKKADRATLLAKMAKTRAKIPLTGAALQAVDFAKKGAKLTVEGTKLAGIATINTVTAPVRFAAGMDSMLSGHPRAAMEKAHGIPLFPAWQKTEAKARATKSGRGLADKLRGAWGSIDRGLANLASRM